MRLVISTIVALAVASTAGSVLRAESKQAPASKQVAANAETTPAASQFATLKGVKAAPMAAKELDAVKGQHVHFLDAGGEKLHLAGDVKHFNNWENLGGSDGAPVAPSYHGLCVASGYSGPGGGVSIPGGQFECPL